MWFSIHLRVFQVTDRVYTERDGDSQVARFLFLSVCVRVIVMNVPLEECVKQVVDLCILYMKNNTNIQ